MQDLNENQKHALALLDSLLAQDAAHAKKLKANYQTLSDEERANFKYKKRTSTPGPFIASRELAPAWHKLPEQWAPDWCEGWAFSPGQQFASALGIRLLTRSTNKKKYMVWLQESDFDFKEGQTIHSYPLEFAASDWQTQIRHNPVFLQIVKAIPVDPVDEEFKRNAGYVRFKIFKANKGHIYGEEREAQGSQDDFVRYLITGILPTGC